jgi:hypothetical protein
MSPHEDHERDKLLRVIRHVRGRWRWRVLLRSLTVLVGAAVLTVLAAAWGLERWRFRPEAIVAFRVVTYLVLVGLGWWFLVRPLMRRVTDIQVALYLEEHEPTLETLLLSAVDGSLPGRREGSTGSSALLERLVQSAVERCERIRDGRNLERRSMRRSGQVLATIGVAAAIVFLGGPSYLRQGAMTLLVPIRSVEAASPYRIDLTPGDTTLPRGADLAVAARLVGFASTEGGLFTRSSPGAAFERVTMIPGKDGVLEATIFRLRESLEYFVESAGVRSATHKVAVADLPQVDRLELEYVFPAYTGLSPQKVENGGDIAVLAGTKVRVRVHSTLPASSGRVVVEGASPAALAGSADATLDGEFEVLREGSYRVELQAPTGQMVPASPQYAIDILTDQPPSVTFSRPQRDLRPTSLEEVFAEARAEDDFGLERLDLMLSVNGGGEKAIRLGGSKARAPKQLSAGHTFFLEEMNLQPGDVVSYYARATDNDSVSGGKTATSDIYFLRIRPLRKDYRAAESQGGGQAGGGQGDDPSALSDEQRRIVTGTFNVARDKAKVSAEKFREDNVFLALAQGQLRQRVEALAAQISTRLGAGAADGGMKGVADGLAEATKAMREAEPRLQARDPKSALPPEQRALRALQAAEEAYRDVRVTMSQERGGQGGGGSSDRSEELAELFEVELDRLKNQYETFRRSQQQSSNDRVDEMLERLRELARRQEQEAERQRRVAGSPEAQGGLAAGARQRQLAQETEEAARRLERLAREQRRQDLADAARQMQQAADAMRRAAAAGEQGAFGEARAAAERLGQARRSLEQDRTDRLARAIEEARQRVQRLTEEQERIKGEVRGLPEAGAGRAGQARQLTGRKEAQAGEVADVERQLDRTAADFQRERREAARKLQEAADGIRDSRLKEKIRYSRGLIQNAPPDAASAFEEQIGADLSALGSRLAEAARAASSGGGDSRAEALERARDLLRGVESMNERTRDGQASGRGQPDRQDGRQQAAAGQQGQQGQPQGGRGQQEQQNSGQQGQRGQQGARGTTGQQGQAGQGGESQNSGQQAGNRQQADGRSIGSPPEAAGGGGGRPGPVNPEQARQLRREARERGAEAEQLRRDLRGLGVEPRDLDRLIRELRALDTDRVYQDPTALARLQAQLLEGFRRFEFDLRRKLDAGGEVLLSGAEDVPPEYRALVEEYYRALAREKKK